MLGSGGEPGPNIHHRTKKAAGVTGRFLCKKLLLHDFQQFHGANLGTDAAGDALGSRIFRLHDHNLHGAGFHALAAADTQLLIDHVNAGLGILGNCTMLTGSHALAALDAGNRLSTGTLGNHLDAGQVLVKYLVECGRAGTDTFQTCHTLNILLNSQLLHSKSYPFSFYSSVLYRTQQKIAMVKFFFSEKIWKFSHRHFFPVYFRVQRKYYF